MGYSFSLIQSLSTVGDFVGGGALSLLIPKRTHGTSE